jgi:hypothetical protein
MLPLLCSRQLPVQVILELLSMVIDDAAPMKAPVAVIELRTMESRVARQTGLTTDTTVESEKVRFCAAMICEDGSVKMVGEATTRAAKMNVLLLELNVLLDALTITDGVESVKLPTSTPARMPAQLKVGTESVATGGSQSVDVAVSVSVFVCTVLSGQPV